MRRYNNSGSGKTSFMRSKGELNSAPMDRLSQYNYPKLLSNPLVLNADVRVPDGAAMIPTCTFDVEYQFEVNPNAEGVGGFFLALTGKPQLFKLCNTSTASNFVWSGLPLDQNVVEMTNPIGASTTLPLTGSQFNYTDNTIIPNQAFWDSADANYRGWRVVAAGTKVEFSGNDTQNSGIIQACQVSGGFETSNTVAAPSRVDYSDSATATSSTQNQYSEGDHYIEQVGDWNGCQLIGLTAGGGAVTASTHTTASILYASGVPTTDKKDVFQKEPVIPDIYSIDTIRTQYHAITKPAKDGIIYNWLPRSPSDFKYRRPSTNFSRAGTAVPWLTWDFNKLNSATAPAASPNFPNSSQVQGPALKLLQVGEVGSGGILCVINGASTGTGATWRAKIVIHYEALPETNGNLTNGGKYAVANHQASMAAIGQRPGK